MAEKAEGPRLFLVTPRQIDAERFPARLAEALASGDVAAVLIASEAEADTIAALVPVIQRAGAAAIVMNDTLLAGHVKADGVHIEGGIADLRTAVESFRPKRIVGAGRFDSRHTSIEAGELDVDYVFFGRPHGDTHDSPHPKALDLGEWWSEVMQIPAVVMAGRSPASIAEVAAAGAEFVGVGEAVWSHPDGPAAAISEARSNLLQSARHAA
jgi:thiamine-phosphate pyrophosphorylase